MFISSLLVVILGALCSSSYATEVGPKLGKLASQKKIKQWDTDIFPNGRGLPKGKGNVTEGKKVYQKYCLSCHGVDGSGDSADELAGAMHSLTDNPPDKTIGTYWPYATTLFDFTRRSMPLNSPGILSNNQLYAVTAYMLYLNGIVSEDKVLNVNNLAKIKMPNRNGFINIYKKQKNTNSLVSQ